MPAEWNRHGGPHYIDRPDVPYVEAMLNRIHHLLFLFPFPLHFLRRSVRRPTVDSMMRQGHSGGIKAGCGTPDAFFLATYALDLIKREL
ncbi:hypothetical protein [Rhodospirillum centenum]|uniref:hypothetical protein n=1 Tax=Rhodospirillum centenum TaxID=34018 RepID=UPI0011D11C11|nr:hypothetical protein [Rhodospirillum centenum]